MRQVLVYAATILVSGLVFAAVYAPAPLVWRAIQDRVPVRDLTVLKIDGSIWQGDADVQYHGFPVTNIQWELAPLPLIGGHASIAFSASGSGHELVGNADITDEAVTVTDLNGHMDGDFVNGAAQKAGLSFDGTLKLQDLTLAGDGSGFTFADGSATWSGGEVGIPNIPEVPYVVMPPLSAELEHRDDRLTLLVTHGRSPVMDIELAQTGWATLRLRKRLIDLAGLQVQTTAGPDEFVLTIEEKIL